MSHGNQANILPRGLGNPVETHDTDQNAGLDRLERITGWFGRINITR